MKEKKDIVILGIESSCDETAASVVRNGREVLSNVISSQIALHTLYGGVVPEIASRKHIEKINVVIEQALSEAQMTLDDLDAIGVTYGPGLVGALLVGVSEAKAIAYAAGNEPQRNSGKCSGEYTGGTFCRKLGTGIRGGRNTAEWHGIGGKIKRVQCLLCGRCGGEKDLSYV